MVNEDIKGQTTRASAAHGKKAALSGGFYRIRYNYI